MGKSWYDSSEVARKTFDAANDILGYDMKKLCFEGPDDVLNRTDHAQPAIYTASTACYRAIEAGEGIDNIIATAGLSLGEFTALHLAGAYDFETGLRLVHLRGQAMQEAAGAARSGMVALIGVDEQQAEDVCLKAMDRVEDDERILVPANFNCPGQVVISGSLKACEAAVEVAGEISVAAKALAVAGAFHSPIMSPAARKLAKALDETKWADPKMTVLSNVTGRPHVGENVESIKGLLVEQLTRPVMWASSMEWLGATGEYRYMELAPGKVLSGLMKRIDRKRKVDNFAEAS
jgi:[acyl-carrier-protein] S-malonyltransferase